MGGPGAGHMLDMINRIKQNRSLRKSNHFRDLRKAYRDVGENSQLNFQSATPEQLDVIRHRVRAHERRSIRRRLLTFIISIVLVGAFFALLSKLLWHMLTMEK